MGVCCSCCRRKTIEEDDDEDDLAATTATAAKDADAKDVKVDIDAAVSSLDAGTVEIVVARLRTVDARAKAFDCLLYTSPSPRDRQKSRMPSSA